MILRQPDLWFVQYGDRTLHEFIHGLVEVTLDILLNQILKLGPEADFHRGVLAQDSKLLVGLKSAPEGACPSSPIQLAQGRLWAEISSAILCDRVSLF